MGVTKRWFSLLMAAIIACTALCACVPALAADREEEAAQEVIAGTFRYPDGGSDVTSDFYYSDTYFVPSAYEYQDSLATMSLCMALSAFASEDGEGYAHQAQNLEALLVQCGFPAEHFAVNDAFREKPTNDSIGVAASHKTIVAEGKPYTLIAVSFRGAGYESEWASNITVGSRGSHQGFSEARDQALSFLKDYVRQQHITGAVKLWIAGYSRGAATANMTAARLDDGFRLGRGIRLHRDDLYAYCFESPQGASRREKVTRDRYGNIFNIVNPSDLVTKLAPTQPEQFGFRRYGVNCYLPTALKEGDRYAELQAAMLAQFSELPCTVAYTVDNFQMKEIDISRIFRDPAGAWKEGIIVDNTEDAWDLNAFLDETFYQLFGETIGNRKNYVDHYEQDLRELCRALFGSGDGWQELEDLFLGNLRANASRIAADLILLRTRDLVRTVETALTDALHQAGITDYSAGEIREFAGKMVDLLLSFGAANPDLLVTAMENLSPIGCAHYPQVCLAWLRSFDPHYVPQAQSAFNSGIHRVVHISGAADVQVHDSNEALVASVVDGKARAIEGSTLVTYRRTGGEQLLYLPADEAYTVTLEATEDSSVSYGVQEYSEAAGGVTRLVNFYDLELPEGGTCTGLLPNLGAQAETLASQGSRAAYTLYGADGTALTADEEHRGDEAAAANCRVTVTSGQERRGSVSGDAMVKLGGQTTVYAQPRPGSRFTGWYRDGRKVSGAREYTFSVRENTALEARFASMGR